MQISLPHLPKELVGELNRSHCVGQWLQIKKTINNSLNNQISGSANTVRVTTAFLTSESMSKSHGYAETAPAVATNPCTNKLHMPQIINIMFKTHSCDGARLILGALHCLCLESSQPSGARQSRSRPCTVARAGSSRTATGSALAEHTTLNSKSKRWTNSNAPMPSNEVYEFDNHPLRGQAKTMCRQEGGAFRSPPVVQ